MPVAAVTHMLTKEEVDGWLSYFAYKDPDAQELQMAILIATARNAMSSKAKSKVTDFIITKKPKKTTKVDKLRDDEMIHIGKYQPIKKADLHRYLK